MEFDLALSCIREYVYAAVLIAKDIKSDEGSIDDIDIDEYINNAKEEIDEFIEEDKVDMDIAYQIYKPLLKGNASKAVCAQYLSKILLRKSNELLKSCIIGILSCSSKTSTLPKSISSAYLISSSVISISLNIIFI